jgi:hypothetical protein
MLYSLDGIGYIFFKKSAEDLGVKVGNCSQDKKHLHPGNGD